MYANLISGSIYVCMATTKMGVVATTAISNFDPREREPNIYRKMYAKVTVTSLLEFYEIL